MIVEGIGQQRLISVESGSVKVTVQILKREPRPPLPAGQLECRICGRRFRHPAPGTGGSWTCSDACRASDGITADVAGPWVPEATISLDVNHAEALEAALRAARLEAEARSKSL